MPDKVQNLIVGILLLFIVLGTVVILYLNRSAAHTAVVRPVNGPTQAPRTDVLPVPNQDKFTKYEYILPRKPNNDKSQSVYSSVAQLRGRIVSSGLSSFTVSVAGNIQTVAIPGAVRLYCVPAVYTDPSGHTEKGREIYFDFTDDTTTGKAASAGEVTALLTSGREVGAVVDVTPDNRMTARIIISYDCPKK
jgi:hypothetical protein